MMTDIEIAQSVKPKNIYEIAQTAGIDEKYIIWKKPVRLELNNIQFWENEGV